MSLASVITHESDKNQITEDKSVDFGMVPIESEVEKFMYFENDGKEPLTYKVSLMYVLNNVDSRVFRVSIDNNPVTPGRAAHVRIVYRPNIVDQSFTEYYVIDSTAGRVYHLSITGKCYGPKVILNKRKLIFTVSKNLNDNDDNRHDEIEMINYSTVDTTYQWLLPYSGQGYFQISPGHCGMIRALENITTSVVFTGTALGVYTAELACLVLNQEPQFLNVVATVSLPGDPFLNISDHKFHRNWKEKCRNKHLMENSLTRLTDVPAASVYERHLDFGTGSVSDLTRNISQSLSVTNHGEEEGYIQWMPDPENVFLIDPIALTIPPKESRMFTVRFRPKEENQVYGYLMPGDYQYSWEGLNGVKLKHSWFRIPCTGNTWPPCHDWPTEFHCFTEITMPPTVPYRTAFTNFMLSNKLDVSMQFKFLSPDATNFALLPMCGIVQSRGWQIITVAFEPKGFGDYYENWELNINNNSKVRICICGNAEMSQVEVMSHGYNPETNAVIEFQPTITGCISYATAYLHNLTRMNIHLRVLNAVQWLGADGGGTVVLPPREIVRYHWWFYPKEHDKVYETTVTCTILCLIDDNPVGEPEELFIQITGYSELPDLKALPRTINLHDIVVGESATFNFKLYNNGICFFTSNLFHEISGMDDDYSNDTMEMDNVTNTLKPSQFCEVNGIVTPQGAGPRQLNIKYTVFYRDEDDCTVEIMPLEKVICIIWYDGIYPTMKVKRAISVQSPVILTNHCAWNIVNIDALNKALVDVRPHKTLTVDLFAPDLCIGSGNVEIILVMGCVFGVPVAWNLKREKICDCEMIEVQYGTSLYTMRHTCIHRPLVELAPRNGIVSPETPCLLYLFCNYDLEGDNTLRYCLTMPNERTLYLDLHIKAYHSARGILLPLRRPINNEDHLAVLDCGRVPINNLDPVIRIAWLYNPTDVFTTWRLLRGNSTNRDSEIRCLLYFAEVAPLGRLSIPFAFMPTEMIDYEFIFHCSFGYDTVSILVTGQGGLPNTVETRLDVPLYVEKRIRNTYRENVVFLSREHVTISILPTHSLTRDILSINNDTDHVMRFIWLPERIANVVNIVMTPCWGVIQPKCCEWITMSVYTLQEPATFTITVACELLDLTARRKYQRNELLRRNKLERCHQEFIITEKGLSHPGINDYPPYVLDLKKPQPFYIALSVSVSSEGQRDAYTRMYMKQLWEQTPAYDLLPSDVHNVGDRNATGNNMSMADIIRIIDGILWDALHSKLFQYQIKFYAKEQIPIFSQLMKVVDADTKTALARRVTSGICDAIVNKAVFHIYGLSPKHDVSILEV